MAYISDGTISIKNNNDYCIRHVPSNINWEYIKSNNILFIYGHALHYDIVKSEISTINDKFKIDGKQPVQLHYALEIPNTHNDYYNINDSIHILYNDIDARRNIRSIDRGLDTTRLFLNEPLLLNQSVLLSGEGIIVQTKNKIFLSNKYISDSIYDSYYHISQEFTKNLSLPLMEMNDIKYGPIAALYNKAIKRIDEAVEHSRMSFPNLVCKTEYLSPSECDYSFSIQPPLNYTPQIFSEVYNIINKSHYGYGYQIYDITSSGYKLHLDHPISEKNWTLNSILIPDFSNYEKFFIGYPDSKKCNNTSQLFTLDFHQTKVSNGEFVISLYKPFNYKINKMIMKTEKDRVGVKLKISNNPIVENSSIANPELYNFPLRNSAFVEQGQPVSVELSSVNEEQVALNLDISLECERL